MNTGTSLKPRASELSAHQREIRSALERIAELEPSANECVSEVALVVASTRGQDWKACQNTYRLAFELLSDRGYARRSHNYWRFRKRFTTADVGPLIEWRGKWQAIGVEADSSIR